MAHQKELATHDQRVAQRKVDNLIDDDGNNYAPSLAGSVQDENVRPQVGLRPWLIVASCAFSYCVRPSLTIRVARLMRSLQAMLWSLVAIGLQRSSIVAANGGESTSIWSVRS
jgi:hypothetical protein